MLFWVYTQRPKLTERVIIVGGCRLGKSTLARSLGLPIHCADPRSKVKDVEAGVVYLPESLPMAGDDGAAQWVADHWLTLPGPWVVEGWLTARVLRRWVKRWEGFDENGVTAMPADRIILLTNEPWVELKPGQASLNKAVATVWREIEDYFSPITEFR